MAKFVWSVNPLTVSALGSEPGNSPLTASELACLGIPRHKIPRVEYELARLCRQNPPDQALLPALARQIARQLL